MKTGYSLSLCVRDIARGKVALGDVDKIVASTCYHSPEEFDQVIAEYMHLYWCNDPIAENVARILEEEGRIEQPRLTDPMYWRPITATTLWEPI